MLDYISFSRINLFVFLAHSKVHEDILNKYADKNKQFYMNKIIYDDENVVLGYDWIYLFENNKILVNYYLNDQTWKIISIKSDFDWDEKQLNLLLDSINQQNQTLSFQQQIQLIEKDFSFFFTQSKKPDSSPDLPILSPTNLSTTPSTTDRRRLDSTCSSTNSIKYAE